MSYISHFLDSGTFISKNSLCPVTLPEIDLMTPKIVKCSAHNFIQLFLSNAEVSILKSG